MPRYQGKLSLLRAHVDLMERHFRGAGYNDASQDHSNRRRAGCGAHPGSRLLADVTDRTTLTGELSEVLAGLCKPRARHDPGRVLVDMAVAVADGATTIDVYLPVHPAPSSSERWTSSV